MNKIKVYTKTGDAGTTELIGGVRVPKHHIRLEAYGTIDELSSYIGLIRSYDIDERSKEIFLGIQEKLFLIGSYLATDSAKPKLKEKFSISDEDIAFLEKEIDIINEELPKLNNFVLPGNNHVNGFCHVARTVCRRAERRISHLATETDVNPVLLKYINRLSDYLFVYSRKVLNDLNIDESIFRNVKY